MQPSSNKKFSVGIVGCGLIGRKRAFSLGAHGELIACVDADESRSEDLAKIFNATSCSWQSLLENDKVDIIIISTLHDSLAQLTLQAIQSGKHVLVEKPAARNAQELEPVLLAAKEIGVKVRVGFNHRYHRALLRAKALVDAGELGELMFIRGRYGHGARIGYEKEWRSKLELSGGGELIDQGPHLIDLSRWFLGEFDEIDGFSHTFYWDMPVDDNAFLILKTKEKKTAFLQVSCTEWKNLFSLEIYGKKGKIDVSGLGGSYGIERLAFYKMLPEMGPPETTIWEFPMVDDSWATEMNEFYDDILQNREPAAGLSDALATLKIVDYIYMGKKIS